MKAREVNPMDKARFFVLIPCGGSGTRAGMGQPKQYRVLAGRSVLAHTLAAFAALPASPSCPGFTRVVVAISQDGDAAPASPTELTVRGDHPAQLAVSEATALAKSIGVAGTQFEAAPCAGATRGDTVLNGLNWLLAHGAAAGDWVLVHDAARCLITPAQIVALMTACVADAVGGLLAYKLADTLKQEGQGAHHGRVRTTLDRSDKWLAQTPQMFRAGALQAALIQAAAQGETVTDEASAMELIGRQPLLVPGSAQNFKLTYPEDFALAEAVLRGRTP